MLYLFFVLLGCTDPPSKELPPSKLQPMVQGQMIQYNKLKGFLVHQSSENADIWMVPKVTSTIRDCAQKSSKTVLVIADSTKKQMAIDYLSNMVKGTVVVLSSLPSSCGVQ